ncbi:hypothetical protein [Dysgonomonas sp. 520]|uniref:hypothetical protein n=1 Tax=Dysgonomonas sp. 520 TaxID=2302931 RepID=UPI0013D8234F|nr:hypothetical protein [Dysgonomonas sp. 520]NDW11183.1 hypothetical protein [Dysgonomonas sp. 520]
MNINNFMQSQISGINDIIRDLGANFSSHHFIEKFSQKYESHYIDMLVDYRDSGNAFMKVHGQIAKFLSENMHVLQITKDEKKPSENIFGNEDIIQWWNK